MCSVCIIRQAYMQGSNKTAAARAYRRVAPKTMELALLPLTVASTFCDRLLALHRGTSTYFDPAQDRPQPITSNPRMEVFMQRLYFLGDTRSRRELIVFAEANPSRLPLAMGIAQASISVRRMAKMTGKVDCLML